MDVLIKKEAFLKTARRCSPYLKLTVVAFRGNVKCIQNFCAFWKHSQRSSRSWWYQKMMRRTRFWKHHKNCKYFLVSLFKYKVTDLCRSRPNWFLRQTNPRALLQHKSSQKWPLISGISVQVWDKRNKLASLKATLVRNRNYDLPTDWRGWSVELLA